MRVRAWLRPFVCCWTKHIGIAEDRPRPLKHVLRAHRDALGPASVGSGPTAEVSSTDARLLPSWSAQVQRADRCARGLMPVSLRNVVAKWLVCSKPHRRPTSITGIRVVSSNTRALSMRSRMR